jgi:hypothetical protein
LGLLLFTFLLLSWFYRRYLTILFFCLLLCWQWLIIYLS